MARSTTGWLKVYREAWTKDLGSNVYLWALWHALLNMATWKTTKIIWEGKQRELPPGSVVFGIAEIAVRWGCSRSVIKKWLRYLDDTGRIVLESCPRGTLIQLVNWAEYQFSVEDACPQRGDNMSAASPQYDINEPLSKKRTIKNERTNIVHVSAIEEIYRSSYPLKKGKSRGLNALSRQIQTADDLEDLKRAIDRYSASEEVSRGFIKHFGTFASEWRDWLDIDAGESARAKINTQPIDVGVL